MAAAILTAALFLVLGSGPVLAFEVIHAGSNATGIVQLDVDGVTYDVTFRNLSAGGVYGQEPGIYDFKNLLDAQAAVDAVNAALNTVPEVETVGSNNSSIYNIGVGFENDIVFVREGSYSPGGDWEQLANTDFRGYSIVHTYADFDISLQVKSATWGRLKELYR
jgi:hypothetical protein